MTSTNQPTAEAATCHIRWMIRRDMPEVMAIEEQLSDPMEEETLHKYLKQRNCIGMVAEWRELVVGHCLYYLQKDCLELIRLAVGQECRRLGVGSTFMEKLKGKLPGSRRKRLTAWVDDRNLPAHLFLKSAGLRAVETRYNDDGTCEYLFQFKKG